MSNLDMPPKSPHEIALRAKYQQRNLICASCFSSYYVSLMDELPEYDPSRSFSPLLMSFEIPVAISPLAKEEKVSVMVFPISAGVFEMLH
jgi:hypothetical protein